MEALNGESNKKIVSSSIKLVLDGETGGSF
jgi:hypothetical protein